MREDGNTAIDLFPGVDQVLGVEHALQRSEWSVNLNLNNRTPVYLSPWHASEWSPWPRRTDGPWTGSRAQQEWEQCASQ